MSKPSCHAVRMKINESFNSPLSTLSQKPSTIAFFGLARLVWWPSARSGRYELIGGTADDHAEAREWCSLFAHEVVFTSIPRCIFAIAFAA